VVQNGMEHWRFMVMELAHAGYGDPETLMNTRVDFVFDAHEHLVYRSKFEYQCMLLNRED
jgi:hypothetical protein